MEFCGRGPRNVNEGIKKALPVGGGDDAWIPAMTTQLSAAMVNQKILLIFIFIVLN